MPDFDEILKMAQNAQAELQKAQEKLDTIEVEGSAGGGMVSIRATAKGRVLGVTVDESLRQPAEKTMLAAAAQELNQMTSALPTPPGFKLPF